MVYIPPMPAHCFHLTPYYGLPCNQLGPIAIPGTHSDFSPPYGDTNISTDLLAHALRLVQQGPSFLSLAAQAFAFLLRSKDHAEVAGEAQQFLPS